jgi:hypothetical protein
MKSRLIRRAGAATLIAAVAATALTGCGGGIGAKLTFDDTEQAKVTDIVVAGNSGDVAVSTAAGTQTRIKRVVHSSGQDPEQSYTISGSTLSVDTACGRNCSVSYEIQAPAGVKVRGNLHSGGIALVDVAAADVSVTSGDIRLERITGDVTAKASSGNIDAHALSGATNLSATSGNVTGLELTGGKPLTVEASSGNIELHLMQPASVTARVSSGNVDVYVPNANYKIRDDTGSGEFTTNLHNDDSSANVINVRTGSGNVKIMGS